MAAHPDWLGDLQTGISLLGIQRMTGGIETALGRNKHIVAKGDLPGIHKNAVIVGKKMVAHLNIPTKAAENIGLYIGILTHFSENFADQFLPPLHITGAGVVIFIAKVCADDMGFFSAGKTGIIPQTLLALFQFCHSTISNC